jgi:hypothetical protein
VGTYWREKHLSTFKSDKKKQKQVILSWKKRLKQVNCEKNMARPAVPCTYPNGACGKTKECDCGCGKCRRHCAGGKASQTGEEPAPRQNQDRSAKNEAIRKNLKIITDEEQDESTADNMVCHLIEDDAKLREAPRTRFTIEKAKDFLPPNSTSINHLLRCGCALNRVNVESNERYFRSFLTVIDELATSLATSLCKDSSPRGTTPFIEQTKLGLIRRFQDQLAEQPGTLSEGGKYLQKLFSDQMEIYKISPPGSDIRRYIRAAMCQLPEDDLVHLLG